MLLSKMSRDSFLAALPRCVQKNLHKATHDMVPDAFWDIHINFGAHLCNITHFKVNIP